MRRNRRISFLGFGDPRDSAALSHCFLQVYQAMSDVPRYNDLDLLFYHPSKVLADGLGLPEDHHALSSFDALHSYYRSLHLDKVLAFLMGQHCRLGRDSPVQNLRSDLVESIVGAFFGLPPTIFASRHATTSAG